MTKLEEFGLLFNDTRMDKISERISAGSFCAGGSLSVTNTVSYVLILTVYVNAPKNWQFGDSV